MPLHMLKARGLQSEASKKENDAGLGFWNGEATCHSDMQWASSTTRSDTTKLLENIDRKSVFWNLSGETKSTWKYIYELNYVMTDVMQL